MIALFLVALLLAAWFFLRSRKPNNFPPGPPRLPVIGSLPYIVTSGPKPSLMRGLIEQVRSTG
jgi:hypothetical protein